MSTTSKLTPNGDYSHTFCCYGQPIGVRVKFDRKGARGIVIEGKRKRYCRTCVKIAVDQFRSAIVAELKKVGLR